MPCRLRNVAFLLIALALGTPSLSTLAADKSGVLDDNLDDLQKAISSLPAPTATVVTTGGKPVTNPPATQSAGGGGKAGILGDDLGDIGKATDALSRGGKPPGDGGSIPPVIQPPQTSKAAKVLPDQWFVEQGGGAVIKGGVLELTASGTTGSGTASLRRRTAGDFDLRMDYDLRPASVAADVALSGDLGLRIDSIGDWAGERQVTVDRNAEGAENLLTAARNGELKPALSTIVKSAGGSLRVQRKGNRFTITHHDGNANEWTTLGEIEAKLSPEVSIWVVAFTENVQIHVKVTGFDLTRPSR